jgi:hypothetical protein
MLELPSRMRILPKPYKEGALGLRGMHRITQHANTGDANLDGVAGNERADTGGRAGGDDVAWMQGHHARKPAD